MPREPDLGKDIGNSSLEKDRGRAWHKVWGDYEEGCDGADGSAPGPGHRHQEGLQSLRAPGAGSLGSPYLVWGGATGLVCAL